MLPKVGIILLNWNQYQDTKECLASLSKINYPNYKIVVVDNDSKDGSVDRLEKEFPSPLFIRNRENLGFTGGNNVGIQRALEESADYVLLLNNDTIVKPDFLDVLVKAAEKDPQIGVVGPKIYYYDHPDTIWFAGGGINHLTGQTYHFGLNKVDNGEFDTEKEVDFVTGCAFLVKAPVLKKVGVLDDDYFFSHEDVDLCWRIKKAGYMLKYVPTAIIYHKFAKSAGGRFSSLYIYYRVRNTLLFDLKNKQALFYFVFHLFFTPLKHIAYGLWTLNFRGVRAAFCGLTDFLRGRYGRRVVEEDFDMRYKE
ncbi:MAG: glycosyltransferase family 2 protein [Candidatus Saganbacteria bacterium]|nr:glycosyltransferase family 2 protein [Candidatus Saganbacteria bacterium]